MEKMTRRLRELRAGLARARVGLDAERCGKGNIGAACCAVHATLGSRVIRHVDVQSMRAWPTQT